VEPFAVTGSRNILPLRASAEKKEEVNRLSPVNVLFKVLVFLLIGTGGIVVASRLVAPKKAVAWKSGDLLVSDTRTSIQILTRFGFHLLLLFRVGRPCAPRLILLFARVATVVRQRVFCEPAQRPLLGCEALLAPPES